MHGDGGSIDQVKRDVPCTNSQHTVRDDASALGVLHGLRSCHKAGSSTVPRLCHRHSSLVLLCSTYRWPFLEGSSMAVVTGTQRQSQGITMASTHATCHKGVYRFGIPTAKTLEETKVRWARVPARLTSVVL